MEISLVTVFQILGVGFFIVFLMMFGLWRLHLRIRNTGLVDLGWVLGLALLCALYFFIGHGYWLRKLLILTMVLVWALRLGGLILFRLVRERKEDPRYEKIKEAWRSGPHLKSFLFFEMQALIDLVLSLPFLLVCLNSYPRILGGEWFGVSLWAISLTGEAVADIQLKRFKADARNHGKTCRAGLWNYSRHPNYFFEWMVWVSYFIFALASPWGWVSVICPALMLFFLLKVSGVPAAEAQALRTRGEEYRRYQESTSMFIPWFKKKNETSF